MNLTDQRSNTATVPPTSNHPIRTQQQKRDEQISTMGRGQQRRIRNTASSPDLGPSTSTQHVVPDNHNPGREDAQQRQEEQHQQQHQQLQQQQQQQQGMQQEQQQRQQQQQRRNPGRNQQQQQQPRQWRRQDLSQGAKDRFTWNGPQQNQFQEGDWTPTTLFELFFDDDILDMLTLNSIRYAQQKGNHSFHLTAENLKAFFAILLTSGTVPLPRRRMFWEQKPDVHNEAVSNAMTVNRFEEIMRYFHVADNTNLDAQDKMAKVRPIFTALVEKCLQYFPGDEHLSADESMVPYYGRHSAKQFIRGKPIRFGYKIWCLNTRLGYLVNCEPYQGAGGRTDPQVGLGGSVVLGLLSRLPVGQHHKVYFDNFFTSLKLIDRLSALGIGAAGTVRANRVENCPVKSCDTMKKEPRGSSDFRSDITAGNVVVRWNDNSVVTVVSNFTGVQPLQRARRWSRAESRRVEIQQPHLISQYNSHMGGVDRMDQNLDKYRMTIRSRKWWWPLFAFTLEVAIQNAWILYRLTPAAGERPLDFLAFRREVCAVYFGRHSVRANLGRPHVRVGPLDRRIPPEVRFDGAGHFIDRINTQRRCAECGGKATRVCTKCDVGLHDRCFVAFHTQ